MLTATTTAGRGRGRWWRGSVDLDIGVSSLSMSGNYTEMDQRTVACLEVCLAADRGRVRVATRMNIAVEYNPDSFECASEVERTARRGWIYIDVAEGA